MELRRKRPIYDLNKPEDRAYLLKRGFVWAVIYPGILGLPPSPASLEQIARYSSPWRPATEPSAILKSP